MTGGEPSPGRHQSAPDPVRVRHCPRWLPAATAALSLVVFSLGSWRPAFWLDEATTLHAVRRSWPDVFRLFSGDPSLAPYYLLMKPFAAISESEVWMRLPGIVAMAAAVTLVVWGLCRLLGPVPAGLAGGVWLSIPTFSLYAQMIRPYAFMVLLTVLAAVFWWRSLGSDRRWWSIWFGLSYFGIGLFHMYGLLVVGPLLIAGWAFPVDSRRATALRTLIPMLAAIVVLAPYLFLAARRAPGPGNIRDLTPAGVTGTLTDAIGGLGPAIALTVLSLAGLAGLALNRTRQASERRLIVLSGCWAFGLPLLLIAAQAVGLRTLMPRYFLFAVPGLVVLAALGLWRLYRRWPPLGVAGLGIVIALGIPGQLQVRQEDGHRAGPVREVAAAVSVPALASLPVIARPPDLTLRRLAAYAPEVIEERLPWYLDPSPKGRLMIYDLPPADQLTGSVAGAPAVVVLAEGNEVAENRASWSPKSREVNEALRSVGFTSMWVTCRIGNTTISVEARPDRTSELSPASTVINQIRAVAPAAKCVTG